MEFLIETEINRSLSFLDMKIFPENDKFVTSVFRKETFSGVYINFVHLSKCAYQGVKKAFVFRKIWRALNSSYLRFEIRPFAILPTKFGLVHTL